MNNVRVILLYVLLISCNNPSSDVLVTDILPTPLSATVNEGSFSHNSLIIDNGTKEILGNYIDWMKEWSIPLEWKEENGNVKVVIDQSIESGGYLLSVEKEGVLIRAKDRPTISNALGTLYQLIELNNGKIPLMEIADGAYYAYRGMHLDVARHMFSVAEIKKYLDFLALYKFNKFHWHLTEDQGWRIEIKKYPKLQSIAAYRDETLIGHYNDQPHQFDGKRYGGYYTQEEIKDIIHYADARGIEIIPEIDIPGHSLALLSAYPELGCETKEYKAATKWGVFSDVLCPKEETFKFLENVFSEIIELFPSEYIHIGGDECPKDQWKKSALCQTIMKRENLKDEMELQSYFIQRIEKFINSKGKRIIGWDEILEGGLAPNATVMSWRGVQGGIEAAKEGHDVIMTPTSHCYFDYYQSQNDGEPLAIGGYTPYQKVYEWSPIPEGLEPSYHKYVMGGQGNVWTEYMKTFDHVEYMALTRMITLSEVLWGKHSGSIDQFNDKLFLHTSHWEDQGVNIANHLLDVTTQLEVVADKGVKVDVSSAASDAQIYWKSPSAQNFQIKSDADIFLGESGEYKFYSQLKDKKGHEYELSFVPHKGNTAHIELKNEPSKTYSGNGSQSIINGVIGPDHRYGGSEWLGFSGDDLEATITFSKIKKLNYVELRFFKGEGQWIYLPSSVEVFSIDENGLEKKLGNTMTPTTDNKIAVTEIKFPSTHTKTLKVRAKNYGLIPEGRQGGGHDSWLFVDEIIIR